MKSWLNSELKAFYDVTTEAEVGEVFSGCTGICDLFHILHHAQVVDQSI